LIYHTVITEPAELDIAATARYIDVDLQNPIAADNLLDDIESEVATLETMPKRNPLVRHEYLASLGFRILQIHNYLAFYIVHDEKRSVTIERFLYSRRDWVHILAE
jgi:plasmid stabilization system protein ParE